VTVGVKGLQKHIFELRRRTDGRTEEISIAGAADKIKQIVSEALQA
jgi:hypothetical protein